MCGSKIRRTFDLWIKYSLFWKLYSQYTGFLIKVGRVATFICPLFIQFARQIRTYSFAIGTGYGTPALLLRVFADFLCYCFLGLGFLISTRTNPAIPVVCFHSQSVFCPTYRCIFLWGCPLEALANKLLMLDVGNPGFRLVQFRPWYNFDKHGSVTKSYD